MNIRVVVRLLSWACYFEAGFLLLPLLVALIYGEPVIFAYLITIGICLAVATLLWLISSNDQTMRAREGFTAVALVWILLSAFGALPFTLTGEIPFYVDALFETVSGFTTTGASILTDVESMSHASLFWRSFTHWIGGMGILVLMLVFLPGRGNNGTIIHLMRAESPGPSISKLVPKLRQTAFILYAIYFALTFIEALILFTSKMPVFDSLVLSFGTAGTGGFGIRNDSIASYTVFQQNTITVFMLLFGINFNFYYAILIGNFKSAFKMSEVRMYLGIVIAAIAVITINILPSFASVPAALSTAAFQVGSIITTTGYATADFNLWPNLSKTILVMLMFVGACAGSTGGGIKVSRIMMLLKGAKNQLATITHPRSVKKIKMDGHSVEVDTVRGVHSYIAIYIIIFVGSLLLISIDEMDLVTNFTSVTATLNNIGPGLEIVGPTGNYASFSVLSKFVLIFDMLAGRLELLPMILLFAPSTWKK